MRPKPRMKWAGKVQHTGKRGRKEGRKEGYLDPCYIPPVGNQEGESGKRRAKMATSQPTNPQPHAAHVKEKERLVQWSPISALPLGATKKCY